MTRTPGQIQRFLDQNMHKFDLSVQYLGDEPNAERRDWDTARARWCLLASWPYEAAAGNQSIPAVYRSIHDGHPQYLCDRFYLPATPRDLHLLEKNHIPIFGIETKHPVTDFDVIATSISYPVLSMSFVKMLTMSGIPARWKDRDPNTHPMIMVGGLSYGAPEVLAPVVDCWWLGEVEDEPGNPGIGAVTARIASFKRQHRWETERVNCYQDLALEFDFLYFPRFVDVRYGYEDRTHVGIDQPSKQVIGYTSNLDGMTLPRRKRHVANLDAVPPLDNPPLLYADPAMGSGDLEVARGCPAWCSFCALTYRQKPYRQRSVDYTVAHAKTLQDNMGSVRMAPFSPDLPMHTQRRSLMGRLMTEVSDEVDAPTMRVDDYLADDQFILLQVHGGMDTVTLGVEGNSQRMRDLVGKGTSDEDIKEAVTRGIASGIRKFKLYMITNLPGEDEGDVYRILRLAKDLADIRESMNQPTVRIQFSWTPLMIEANTPMQWFAPQPANRLLGDIWEDFRDLKIDYKLGAKAEENKAAFFQLCQRASRDVGEALVDAMLDVDQACWGGVPRTFKKLIESKLHDHGFTNGYADCFDERFKHDMFGWEFIDQGISVELMWTTYLQMREFAERTESHNYEQQFDRRYHGNEWVARCDERCHGKTCGACDYGDLKIRNNYIRAVDHDYDISTLRVVDQRSQAVRLRAQLYRPEKYRFVGNDHWRYNLRRAAFRVQRQTGTSWGISKRSIRFASDEVKHRDWTCGVDYVEFSLTRPLDSAELTNFIAGMNHQLDPWLTILDWKTHPVRSVTLRTDVDVTFYELRVEDQLDTILGHLDRWHAATEVPMRLKIEGGYFAPNSEQVNAKDFVDDLWLTRRDGHHLHLRMLLRGRPNPYNIYAALTGKPSWLDAARHAAQRIDSFVATDRSQQDFLRPSCVGCGLQIPVNLIDRPYHPHRCPRCNDEHSGAVIRKETTTP
jgi:radical SAM superfamily enzyme YgiQ (UPF0313 family)